MFGSTSSLMFCIVFDACDQEETKKQNFLICGKSYIPKLTITPKDPSPFAHRGIDVEICAEIIPFNSKPIKTNVTALRVSESDTIKEIGEYTLPQISFDQFAQTYHGSLFSVKYFLRVWVRKLFGSEFLEKEFSVYRVVTLQRTLEPIFVSISVRDALRTEVIINRRNYDIDDVIMGALRCSIVGLKIARINAQLIAQETIEINGKIQKFNNIIEYWEVSSGSPVKGEIIPFRFYLHPLELSPSSSNPQYGYSITHLVHLTFITTTGSKYFKDFQIKLMKLNKSPFIFKDEPPRIIDKHALQMLQDRINREKEKPKFTEVTSTTEAVNNEEVKNEEPQQQSNQQFKLPVQEASDLSSDYEQPPQDENLPVNHPNDSNINSQSSIAVTSVGDDGSSNHQSVLVVNSGNDKNSKTVNQQTNYVVDMKKIDDDLNALIDDDEIELQNLDEPDYNPFE